MGQTLSEPMTAKESASLQNSFVKVGSSSMQGWRISMEDAHTHILELKDDPNAAFFAVYDGHGGSKIANYASKHLHKVISERPEYREGDIRAAICKGFLDLDERMKNEDCLRDDMSGCTAITALLKKDDDENYTFYVGNVGDSRCIVCTNGQAVALSVDHKPTDELERQRINDAGGFIAFNRVNGNLALSRAFGDFAFKTNADKRPEHQIISASPDVQERPVEKNWQFAVLACDGIWDVLSNQEVADFVIARIAKGLEPATICEELMMRCLANDCSVGGLGCDNMTVVLVCFLQNRPYQHLIDECRQIITDREELTVRLMQEIDKQRSDNSQDSNYF